MCGEIVQIGADAHDFKLGDKVIVCSVMPVWRSMEAQDGNGGTLVNLSAYFSNASIPIQPAVWGFGYGDKTIKGVGCGGGRLLMSRMAQLIASGRVEPEKLITHRYHGMEQIPEAMNLFLNHDRSLIKPVIYND